MAITATEHVDLVVTSPPYTSGFVTRNIRSPGSTIVFEMVHGVGIANPARPKPGGSFFLNIGAAPSNPMLPHENFFSIPGLLRSPEHDSWIKSIAIDDKPSAISSR